MHGGECIYFCACICDPFLLEAQASDTETERDTETEADTHRKRADSRMSSQTSGGARRQSTKSANTDVVALLVLVW